MNEEKVKSELLSQIKEYLSGNITRDKYYEIAESYYSLYAEYIKGTDFHEVYMPAIADLCMYYIDEPGLTEEVKEETFRREIQKVYEELLLL